MLREDAGVRQISAGSRHTKSQNPKRRKGKVHKDSQGSMKVHKVRRFANILCANLRPPPFPESWQVEPQRTQM